MEIAVFQDISGKTQSFLEPGIIKVYSRHLGKWTVTKEILFRIDIIGGLKAIRDIIINMTEELGDCKVFVGRDIKGMVYNVLDGMGFNTWELEGEPLEFLEFVYEKEEEEAKANDLESKDYKEPQIMLLKDGTYFLDLKKIQENDVNITSKGILLPFLNATVFYQLEIICKHVPHWFEVEFKRLNLKMKDKIIGQNEIKVVVYPMICEEEE
jgi:Fe-only nitrogenase accessory protein AnfO